MAALTLEELNDLCENYLVPLPFYSWNEAVFYQMLYYTGCRPAEAINPSRWSYVADRTFLLNPLKGNNTRTIVINEDVPRLLEYLINGETWLNRYSIAKFRFIWDKFNSYGQLIKGDKGIDLYCFRTLYVKKLKFIDGKTNSEIQTAMGWTNTHLPAIYYNSVIEN
jgi:hypothetical protein